MPLRLPQRCQQLRPAVQGAVVTSIFGLVLQGPLRSAVGRGKYGARLTVCGGCGRRLAGAVCADQRILLGCVPVDPDPSMVLRACGLVWWWRAQLLSAGTVDCCRRARVSEPVSYPPSPEHTLLNRFEPGHARWPGREGQVRDGGSAPAVRGNRRRTMCDLRAHEGK